MILHLSINKTWLLSKYHIVANSSVLAGLSYYQLVILCTSTLCDLENFRMFLRSENVLLDISWLVQWPAGFLYTSTMQKVAHFNDASVQLKHVCVCLIQTVRMMWKNARVTICISGCIYFKKNSLTISSNRCRTKFIQPQYILY